MVKAYIDSLRNDKAKRTRFALMVAIIAIVLFAAVFWTLRFIGITMTDEAGCGLLEHTHTEECYERVLICDIPEGEEHTHTDECYELRLICDKEEHTHTALCYPDTSADVESPEDWEATLPAQEVMTGEWARDIVAVAQSQVGYKESERNYSLEEDGTHNGYTRFGAWYGSPYAPWNAMFVSFCLNYSNVPASVLAPNAGVEAFVAGVNSNYIDKTSGEPLPGDIILLDTDGDGSADKLGVIADVYDDRGADLITTSTGSTAEEAPARRTVRFVMGDMDGAVGETVMTVDNNWILGYVHTSVLNSDYIDNTPVPSEEPEETEQPEETDEPGDVRETEAPEPTQVPMDWYSRGVSDETGTNTNTVIAHVDWGNITNHSGQVITVTLYRNGVATGNTLTLNAANNWTGAFTGLSTGYNYSIEYSEPSGYVMTVTAATEATQSWQQVTSTTALTTSGVYAFIDKSTVNGSTVYRAIGSQTPDNNGEYLEYYSIAHNSGTPIFVPTIAQWSPASSSLSTGGSGTSSSPYYGSAYWENAVSGSYLYKFQDSNSPTGHSFGENNSNDSHHSIKVNFTASAYSGYISYTNSTATYYLTYGALTSGDIYDFLATTTYSNRSIIGLYRKYSGTGYTTDYTLSMSSVTELPASEPQITHNKTIDWMGDGANNPDTTLDNTNPTENNKDDYRLYLDVTGKLDPLDLIIVIDKSNSMSGRLGTDMTVEGNYSTSTLTDGTRIMIRHGNYAVAATSSGTITRSTASETDEYQHWIVEKSNDYSGYYTLYNPAVSGYLYYDTSSGWQVTSSNKDYFKIVNNKLAVLWSTSSGTVHYLTNSGTSYSQSEYSSSGVTISAPVVAISRIRSVLNFLNGVDDSGNGFINSFLSANAYNQLAIVTFSSGENSGNTEMYKNDATIVRNFGRDTSNITLTLAVDQVNNGATNYCAGLYQTDDLLSAAGIMNNGHKKRVVFMSDGEPTVSLSSKDATAETGDGTATTDEVGSETFSTIYEIVGKYPTVDFDAVAFHGPNTSFVTDYLSSIANYGGGKLYDANDAEQLREAINHAVSPSGAVIVDTLSEYVDYNTAQPDLKVIMTKNGVTTTVFQNGSVTNAGSGIIESCVYNAASKSVTLTFEEDYILLPDTTFTVSFNVKINQYAKDQFTANQGYSGMTGDWATDYTGTNPVNSTSSMKPGFYANSSAKLYYNIGNTYYIENYVRPVVQTEPNAEPSGGQGEAVFDHSKTIDWLGDGDPNPDTGASGDNMYRLYLDWSGEFSQPYDLMLVIDKSASMLYAPDGSTATSSNPSRETLVENLLNGTDGLINTFLNANENNRISIVTFGGEPEERMDVSGWQSSSMALGKLIRLVNSDGYGLAISTSSSTGINGYSSSSNVNTYWECGQGNNPPSGGWFLLKNPATGKYLSYDSNGILISSTSGGYYFRVYNNRLQCNVNGTAYYVAYSSSYGYYLTSSSSSALTFTVQGATYDYNYNIDTTVARNWGRNGSNVELNVQENTGTNYEAGLMKAEELWNSSTNPNRIMIFLSDGMPTYWVNNNGTRGGTGLETTDNLASAKTESISAANYFKTNYGVGTSYNVTSYSVLFNSQSGVDTGALAAIATSNTAMTASDASSLINTLNSFIYPSNVKIVDTLSKYVSYNPATGALKVTRVNKNTGAIQVLYENGSITATGQGIIQSVVYTPGDTSVEPTASTGTITVNFVDGFVVDPTYNYTVSFNVTTTKTAENEKAYNIEHNVEGDSTGYAGVTGDVGTDFTYTGTQGGITYNNHNTTSSTMPGFHSNDEAYVSLTLGGEDITDYYDHPVVQVEASSGSETTVENFDKAKVIDWLGDGEENPDTDFSGQDDYRLYLDWSGEFSTPYDLLVIVDVSASMLQGVDGNENPAAGQSREAIVESILNGQNGIINRFLNANWNTTTNKSNNSAAVIKFGGEPDPRLPAASWNTVTTLTNETAVMLYTGNYALADMGSSSQDNGYISRVAPNPTDHRQWWTVRVPSGGNGFYFSNVETGRNILVNNSGSYYDVYLTNTNTVTNFTLSNNKIKLYGYSYYLQYGSSYTTGFRMVSSGGDTFTVNQKTSVQYSYLYDAEVVHSWSNTDFNVDLNVRNDTGTNYAAGLRLAREVLQTSPHQNKIVIFLSDGEPTYWLISDTERGGTGLSSNATNVANAKTASINAANSFKAAFPNVPMYGVMFNTNSTVIENARDVLKAISTSGQAYVAESGAELLEYFNMMTSPSNMVVTDYLSQYVEFNPALGGDIMVTRVNKNTGKIVVLYEETEGGIQTAGQGVIKPGYPKYTPWNQMTADEKAAHPDEVCNGKIELQFVDGFIIDPDYRYTLSFNVHVSEEAKAAKQAKVAVYDAWVRTDPTFTVDGNTYHLFDQDGQLILENYGLLTDETNPTKAYVDSMLNLYCPAGITDTGDYIGDPGTDYSYNTELISNNNHTSSGMPGFRSNHDATVSYTFGHDVVEHYDHPVVQVTVEGEEKPDTNFHNNKVIDWLGDGSANPDTDVDDNLTGEALEDIYRLYLDMSGKQNKGCDLMIIIDRSNSMNESAGNGMTRIDAVNRVLFGPNDNDGLLAEFLSANDGKNRICMIGFGGQRTNGHQNDANYDYSLDSNLIRGWGRDASVPQSGYITAPTDFGTDYSAALLLAGEAWEQVYTDDTNKLMIFLSDGEPSFWIDVSNGVNTTNHTAGRRYGNGTQSSINAETAAGAKATYDWFHAAFPAVHTESVGFGTSFDTNVLNYYAKNGDPNSSAVALRATDYEGLLAALKAQIYPSSIVITDALSKYVRYYSADADLKVTMKREIGTDSVTGDPIYEEATIYENGHIVNNAPVYVGGVATGDTVDGRDYIRRVSYTEGDTSAVPTSSTGTVEVEFNPEFVADPSYVFTVSFNITVTQAAYLAQNNGVAHNVGDEGTDYPGNTSSSNKVGYWSNDAASRVTYNIGSETQNDPYDKPVIQAPDQPVEEETSTGAKATVTKSWDDENDKYMLRPESIIVRLYANGQPTGKYAILSADNGWTYTWNDLPAYDDNGDLIEYSIEEDDVYAYTPVYADPTYSTTGDRQFYVRYYPNEGTGQLYNDGPYTAASANDTITATVKPNVNSDFSFTRAGYTFTGWNTQPDGSGTSYAPGATITLNDHVKLYAQWQQNAVATYTLTYNKNGSDVTGIVPTGGTYESGDTVTVAGKGTLARNGYTFTGWNTAANGSGTSYAPGATLTITANTTLYAQWEVEQVVWYPVDNIVVGEQYLIGFKVGNNVYLIMNHCPSPVTSGDYYRYIYNNVYYGYVAKAVMSGNNVVGCTDWTEDLADCTWTFSSVNGGTITSTKGARYLGVYTSGADADLYPKDSAYSGWAWDSTAHTLTYTFTYSGTSYTKYASYKNTVNGNTNFCYAPTSQTTSISYVQLYSRTQQKSEPTQAPAYGGDTGYTAAPEPGIVINNTPAPDDRNAGGKEVDTPVIVEPTEPEIVPTRTVIVETVVAGAEAAGVDVESLNITSNVTETGNDTTHTRPVVVESVISGAEAAGVDVSNIDAIEEAPAENAAEPAEETPNRSAIVDTVVSGAEAAGVDVADIIEPQKTPEPKAAENDPEPEPERVPDVTVTYTLVDNFERGGAYIIVANSSINGRTGYAVGNFAVSRGHYLAPVAVTVNDNGTLTVSSAVAANILWNASGTKSTGYTLHNTAAGRYMGLDENEFLAPVSVAYLWHYTSDGRLDKGADSEGYRFLSFVTGDTAKFTTSMGKAGGDLSFKLYKLEGELEINVPEPVEDAKKDETPVVVEAVIAGAEAAGVDIDAMLNASSAHAQEAGVPDNTETTEATEAEPDTAVVVEAVIAGAEAAGVDIGDYDYTAYAPTEAPIVTPEETTAPAPADVPEVTPEPKEEEPVDGKPSDTLDLSRIRVDNGSKAAGDTYYYERVTTPVAGRSYLLIALVGDNYAYAVTNMPLYNDDTCLYLCPISSLEQSGDGYIMGISDYDVVDFEYTVSNPTSSTLAFYNSEAQGYLALNDSRYTYFITSATDYARWTYDSSGKLRNEHNFGSFWSTYYYMTYSSVTNNNITYYYTNATTTTSSSGATIYLFERKESSATTYTVTYNSNGATSGSVPTDSNSPYASGATVTVLGNTGNLAKTGYNFNGWNTAADGSGTHYAAGTGTFTITANTVLYAEWTPITYTVSFDANGGTLTGSPSTTYAYGATYGSDTAFTSAPTRSGYTFAGWYTSATGGTQVNGSSTVTSGGVLYAHWTENAPTTYTVTFNPNGGTLTGASTATYNAGSAYNTNTAFTSAPTRSGYTFAGWYTQMNGGTQVSGSSTVTGSTTLYAHWTQNSGSGEYIYQLVDHFEENGEYVIVINGYAVVGSVYDTSNNKYLSRQAVTENVGIVSIPSSVDPNTVLWRANAVTTGGVSGWSLLNLAANKYMAFKGTSTSSDEVITLMTTNNIPWAYDSTNLDLNDQIDSEGYYYLMLNTNYFTTSQNASQGVKLYRRIQQQETTDYTIHWHLGITNKLDRKPLELEKHIAGPTGPVLDGATFIIARCDDNWNIYDSASGHDLMLTATSTNGGQIIFTDPRLDGDGIAYGLNCLPYGKYVINETNTPEGYQGAGPWHVIVDENGARVVDDNGWEIETGTGGNYALINQPVYELPETGGAGVYAYTAVGAMLMLVPAAYLVIDRRKRKHSSN